MMASFNVNNEDQQEAAENKVPKRTLEDFDDPFQYQNAPKRLKGNESSADEEVSIDGSCSTWTEDGDDDDDDSLNKQPSWLIEIPEITDTLLSNYAQERQQSINFKFILDTFLSVIKYILNLRVRRREYWMYGS